jgi:hypoxanthine phosphoribosyltransferase
VTIHSRSGIGIKEVLSEFDIDEISDKQWIRTNILKAKVLIIDEVSMLSANTLDNVERVIQAIKYDHRPWGGMQVIFCGDFFQLPPVSRYGDTKKRFAFASKAWNNSDLVFCYLTSQHRQKEDNDFTQILNKLRVGQVSEHALVLLKERMNQPLESDSPVRLFTHNVDVDRLNQKELMKLPGATKTYTAGTQ